MFASNHHPALSISGILFNHTARLGNHLRRNGEQYHVVLGCGASSILGKLDVFTEAYQVLTTPTFHKELAPSFHQQEFFKLLLAGLYICRNGMRDAHTVGNLFQIAQCLVRRSVQLVLYFGQREKYVRITESHDMCIAEYFSESLHRYFTGTAPCWIRSSLAPPPPGRV